MNEYFTPPTEPASGSRARASLIKEIIDAIDDAFDNIPVGLADSIEDLYEKWVDEIGLPALVTGKYLTNDGTDLDWDDPLPDQTSNSGKFLATDGSSASWDDTLPDQSGKDGFTMQSDGTDAVWVNIPRAGSFLATASGAIDAGKVLALNDDGTVSEVSGGDGSPGSPVTFEAGDTSFIATCYDSTNNKVVVAYRDDDDSGYGKIVVGTITGNSIEFGSTVTFNEASTNCISCCFADGVVFLAYEDVTDGAAIAGTVSGTGATGTISFGSSVDFITSADISATTCVYDIDEDRVVVGFSDSETGKVVVATLTGTSIAFTGSTQSFSASDVDIMDSAYDSNYNRCLFILTGGNPADTGSIGIGVVTDDEIAIVDETALTTGMMHGGINYDPVNNKAVISYAIDDTYYTVYFQVVTVVSGSGFSFGTATEITNISTGDHFPQNLVYDSNTGKHIVIVRKSTTLYLSTGTVDGTDITATAYASVASSVDTFNYAAAVVEDSGGLLVVNFVYSSGDVGKVVLVDHSSTAFDWIGIARSTVTDGNELIVDSIGGINDSQTGLTEGATYYVDVDGDITTSTTSYGEIGRALSATEILITRGGME